MNEEKNSLPQQDTDTETVAETAAPVDATEATEVAETAETAETTETTETAETAPEKPAKKGLFKNKKFRMGATATALTVVFVVAAILLNVIVGILHDRYPLNIDLTSDQLYTLCEDSEKVAAAVKTNVQIIIFGDETDYKDSGAVVLRQLYDFTHDYATLSKGKVTVKFVNATKDPTAYNSYKDYNVSDGSVLFLGESGRSSVVSTADLYEQDEEAAYYYGQTVITGSYVEKVLASNVQAVERENDTGVMLLTGHGESSSVVASQTALIALENLLKKNGYSNCSEVDITTAAAFPENATVAAICAPTEDYSDAELKRLSDWLSNDGKLDRHLVVFTARSAACPRLYAFLEDECGIRVESAVVAETNTANMFAQDYFATYATVQSSDYTTDMASSNERVKSAYTRALKALWTTDSDAASSFCTPLATFGTESAASVPLDENGTVAAVTEEIPAAVLSTHYIYDSDTSLSHTTHTLVFGSELFLSSDIGTLGSNETLFINAFNGINNNGDAISVPSVSLESPTFEMDTATSTVIGLVFAVGLPALMIALGIVVFLRRRHL